MSYCKIHSYEHPDAERCMFCDAVNSHSFQAPQESTPAARDRADAIQIGGTHYKDMAMQPWDVMQAVLSKEEFIGFLRGNVIKYAMRAGRKPGANDDSQKAKHYAQKLAEVTT